MTAVGPLLSVSATVAAVAAGCLVHAFEYVAGFAFDVFARHKQDASHMSPNRTIAYAFQTAEGRSTCVLCFLFFRLFLSYLVPVATASSDAR